MNQSVQTLLTTLIVTAGTIVTAYFTVLPKLLEHQVKDASDVVTMEVIKQMKEDARYIQDSLWNEGVKYMASIEAKADKPPAIVIRVLPDGSFQYNASYNKLQPAWWMPQYKWWMYTDLRDGKLHPILFEEKISLEDMKYRASLLYDSTYLENKIDERIKLYINE